MSVIVRARSRAPRARGRVAVGVVLAGLVLTATPAVAHPADVPVPAGQALPVVEEVPCRDAGEPPVAERVELATLSDASTLRSLAEGRDRMGRIASLLDARQDRRGVLALSLRDVLRDVVRALGDDAFDDPVWVTRLSSELLGRYLDGLHASVTGDAVPEAWRSFYDQAADCGVSPGRVALAGLDAHLVLDLPEAVSASGAARSDLPDYLVLGDVVRRSVERLGSTLRTVHGVDLTDLFRRWSADDRLDVRAGRGVATSLLLPTVRTLAFELGLGLSNPWTRLTHRLAMRNTYAVAEETADRLAALRLL